MPCNIGGINQSSGRTYYLHLQGKSHIGYASLIFRLK